MAGKMIKISGKGRPNAMSMGSVQLSPVNTKHPQRLRYAEPSTVPPNTMRAKRIEDVFIPFYDRPGYTTDNAAQATEDYKMFEIPSGDGRMEQRNLGE